MDIQRKQKSVVSLVLFEPFIKNFLHFIADIRYISYVEKSASAL